MFLNFLYIFLCSLFISIFKASIFLNASKLVFIVKKFKYKSTSDLYPSLHMAISNSFFLYILWGFIIFYLISWPIRYIFKIRHTGKKSIEKKNTILAGFYKSEDFNETYDGVNLININRSIGYSIGYSRGYKFTNLKSRNNIPRYEYKYFKFKSNNAFINFLYRNFYNNNKYFIKSIFIIILFLYFFLPLLFSWYVESTVCFFIYFFLLSIIFSDSIIENIWDKNRKKTLFVTTPIYYINGEPHIGTLATTILAYTYSKLYKFFTNKPVYFSTGTDEHGTKIRKSAESANLPIKNFCDNSSLVFKDIFDKFHIKYDTFIRTTDIKHKATVTAIFEYLKNKELIYIGQYSGYYSISEESFFKENEVVDGEKINDIIVNGKSPNGSSVSFLSQPCYFFKASVFKDKILDFLSNHNLTIPENRKKELENYIKNELKDVCVSRVAEWGISVPNDQMNTIYVWFDALINYLTITDMEISVRNIFKGYENYNSILEEKILKRTKKEFSFKYLQFLGKDISIFHGIIWVALLFSLDFPVENIKLAIHNWFLLDDNKMSKSLGNTISPNSILEKYGVNAFYFYCFYNNLFLGDVNVNLEDIKGYYNDILVGKFSNLSYRIFSLIKNDESLKKYYFNIKDQIKKTTLFNEIKNELMPVLDNLNFREYIEKLLKRISNLNQFIEEEKIWENTIKIKDILNEILIINHFFLILFPDREIDLFSMIFTKIQ